MSNWRDLVSRFGGFGRANVNTSVARGEMQGTVDPELAQMQKPELAEFDRYTHGGQFGASLPPGIVGDIATPFAAGFGTLVAGGNELSKAIPGGQRLIAKLTGDQTFNPDQTTSKPSIRNVLGFGKGVLEGSIYGRRR